jgi:hypothetical protein
MILTPVTSHEAWGRGDQTLVAAVIGSLSAATMQSVNQCLKAALGLP